MELNNDTVFSPSFGNRPTRLVGREGILLDMTEGLLTRPGSKERATVLLGQRGYGKTVLLWELADRARAKGFVVANPTAVREGMVARIAEKLRDDANKHIRARKKIAGGSIGALGISAGLSFAPENYGQLSPEGQLEHLVRELSGRGLGTLLLVDELQANSSEVRALVGTYQELVGEGLNVGMVLAGLPAAASGVLNDRVLTFLNRARKTMLGPLPAGDIEVFFRSSFATCGVDIAPELCLAAAESAQGSPYLMQLIGHYVVLYATGNAKVNESALASAVETAAREFRNDVCKTTLAALSAGDVAYLQAMARTEQQGIASTSEICRELGVTPDYGQQYRRRLIDAGVIQKAHHGQVEFAIPYLAEHLIESQS